MEMTFDNLCNSCTNIGCEFQSGIVRQKCAFYIPPHIEPDNCGNYTVIQQIKPDNYGNYVIIQQTVEAILKDQYEAKLKADKVAMLKDLKKDIDKLPIIPETSESFKLGQAIAYDNCEFLIQQKINLIKENENADSN